MAPGLTKQSCAKQMLFLLSGEKMGSVPFRVFFRGIRFVMFLKVG